MKPMNAAATIHTADPSLLAAALVLGGQAKPDEPPTEDLDVWAPILTAAKGRRLTFARTTAAANPPAVFAAAWAELARDKAKAGGTFAAAIPKPNLAKIAGL